MSIFENVRNQYKLILMCFVTMFIVAGCGKDDEPESLGTILLYL